MVPHPAPTPPSSQEPPAPPAPQHPHILIIGAGITGLLLAQALKAHAIPFTVYERDPSASHRGAGWGLTLHWALPASLALLPASLAARLPCTYVNPAASAAGEDGNFLLLDLRSGEVMWRVPPSRRIRVRREGLREVLMQGVDVRWGKRVVDVKVMGEEVVALFADGMAAEGSLVVGCDGVRSRVRRVVCPDAYQNHELPVRLLGVSVVYPAEKVESMRALDPFFLQAADPKTDVFFWFSCQSSPSHPLVS
jgi:2-polyprenyl-6-methoxyphenol hydroxylase-like FAD-dependent oxidoreductase